MPRDNMATLIQRIARQARRTFRRCGGGGGGGGGGGSGSPEAAFPENLQQLQQLLSQLRAEDLNIRPRRAAPPAPPPAPPRPPPLPPVTYMHICETADFSLGVFLLKSGASIPLHDHPGMHGVLKVLYGTLRISCLDPLPGAGPPEGPPRFEPPLRPGQRAVLRRALLRSRAEYTAASAPCLLSPQRDNLHQIDAVGGPAAFLDVLAPPYDPDHGRDCHYYRLLEPASPPGARARGHAHGHGHSHGHGHGHGPCPGPGPSAPAPPLPREVWLLETPQAADFWCEGEPYPGPKVTA